jgi:hypothetical protein
LWRPHVFPALTRGRLSWVEQNYVRAETITRANARLASRSLQSQASSGQTANTCLPEE